MLAYEKKLDADLNFAFREGSMHFEEKNAVHDTLRRIAQRLAELKIPYAIVGGMAMFAHGFRRFTEDVDILVTRESMDKILSELKGLGYVQPAGTSTKLRDTTSGVKIEFLITGGYPGDGKPKSVSFPDPAISSTTIAGIDYVNAKTLFELKLASGISAAHRSKDIGDAQELIKALGVPRSFGDELDSYVRPKFFELWDAIASAPPSEND